MSEGMATEPLTSAVTWPAEQIEEALNVFVDIIHRAAEPMEVTSTKSRIKRWQPRWWTKECEQLKSQKYCKLKKFKTSNNPQDLIEYKNARSGFKNMCNIKKMLWKDKLKDNLIKSKSDPVTFWKTVKSLNPHCIPTTDITAIEWLTYFEKLLNQEVEINVEFSDIVTGYTETHDSECEICKGTQPGSDEIQELNNAISSEEILKCIKDMSNGKAAGIDGVVVEMLKSSNHIVVPFLKHLYNTVLSSGNFPKQWCQAVLVPIHKKGNKSDPNNYRGIALISVLGKIFAKIVNNRLVEWAETCGAQKEEQAGFRKGYSTTDNIFTLQALIQKYCSRKGGRLYTIFVDFSKAFDTIPHSLMFYQLMTKGVHGKVLNVLRSMYSSLESCVRTPDGLTSTFHCTRGTRQGCMLSPFLFSLYVGELVSMLEAADCRGVFVNEDAANIAALLFADDVVGMADTVGRLQKIINVIEVFCDKWGLIVNLSKSKVMVFRNGGPLRKNEAWYFKGKKLEVVSSYKYLGTMFTPKLSWSLCQKTLSTQAQRGLYLIRRYNYACDGLPVDLLFELFDSMIAPVLLYSSEVWGFTLAKDIEKVQTNFCRYVLGVPSHTPNNAVLSETGRVPMYVRYFKRCIKYWLKVIAMPNNRYPKACYRMLYQLDEHGRSTWATSVKVLLIRYGFQEVWDQQSVGNRIVFFREFTDRVEQRYIEEWEYEVGQSSKLSLFRSIASPCIEPESYLFAVKLRKYRAGLAKLRCSAHSLRIEKGRHVNELMAERVCRLCERNGDYVLDDEYHFILCCPSLAELRVQYLPMDVVTNPDYSKFIKLLKDENKDIQTSIAAFIFQASKCRIDLLTV